MKEFTKEEIENAMKEIGYKPPFTKIREGVYSFDFGGEYKGMCGDGFIDEFSKVLKDMMSKPESFNFPPATEEQKENWKKYIEEHPEYKNL
jgi:hypothetical protein